MSGCRHRSVRATRGDDFRKVRMYFGGKKDKEEEGEGISREIGILVPYLFRVRRGQVQRDNPAQIISYRSNSVCNVYCLWCVKYIRS